jgi:prevent-host-death family protein
MGAADKRQEWQLQEAKAKLSDVIKRSSQGPQVITVRGEEAAVILSMESYKKLTKPGLSLYDFLQKSPLKDLAIDLKRNRSTAIRDTNL